MSKTIVNTKTKANKKTKIAILGIGAIGSALSYFLQQNKKHQLSYYNRSPRPALKINNNNITTEIPIDCFTEANRNQKFDWLLICLKEHYFAEAKPFLEKLISPNTKVAVIRNGLRLKEPILPFTAANNILECTIDCPCQPNENQFYTIISKPKITIPEGSISASFSNLFHKKDVQVEIINDFKTASWKKLCESASLGAILCLSGETCRVFKDSKMKTLYINLLKEAIEVARADGAIIKDTFVNEMLEKLDSYPGTKGSSMLTDRLNGRPIELGAKNGIIVELGKVYDVATPTNDRIVAEISRLGHL